MVIPIASVSFLLTLAGFLYGAFHLFRGKKPLYFQLLVLSTGCVAFECLSALVNGLTGDASYITLGQFGVFGALLFLLSSDYGALNHLVDDGVGTRAYRRIALAAPILSALALVGVFFLALRSSAGAALAGILAVILFPTVPASYFSLKYLILPDDALGLLSRTRPINLCTLLFELSLLLSAAAALSGSPWGIAVSVLPSLLSALISVLAVAEERLWKI